MVLTPAGERAARNPPTRCSPHRADRGRDSSSSQAPSDGILRLTTECYTCYHWLPALLKRYRAAHPTDRRSHRCRRHRRAARHLLEGRLDVAIVSDPVRDRRILATPLFDDEVVVIVSTRGIGWP